MSDLTAERARSQKAYFEFLRVPALSMGVYFLPAGGNDPQRPHREDEVYYVVSGRATVRADGERRPRAAAVRRVPSTSLWLGHAGDARDLRAVLAAGIEGLVDLALEEP